MICPVVKSVYSNKFAVEAFNMDAPSFALYMLITLASYIKFARVMFYLIAAGTVPAFTRIMNVNSPDDIARFNRPFIFFNFRLRLFLNFFVVVHRYNSLLLLVFVSTYKFMRIIGRRHTTMAFANVVCRHVIFKRIFFCRFG